MTQIPLILILSRIVLAIAIVGMIFTAAETKYILISSFIILGVLTDIFDGIIARKLNVATEKLRVWDSNADVIFWLASLFTVFYLRMDFFLEHILWIALLFVAELLTYITCFLKFKRTVATHSYLAKFWTLTLLIFLVDLALTGDSVILFWLCIIAGLISRLEIILILLRLNSWTTDIPSIFALKRINQKN